MWHSSQAWLPNDTPEMVMVSGAGEARWVATLSGCGSVMLWQSEHVTDGVRPAAWQMSQDVERHARRGRARL